jgi:hypothetical protein
MIDVVLAEWGRRLYRIQSGEILARPALSTFVDLLFSVVGKQLGTDYLS